MYCCAFNHSFAQNILFLMKAIFIQGAFQHIQGLLWKEYPTRISHNFSIFKDFSRLLWIMVSQFWMTLNAYSNRFRFVKCSNRAIILLGHFDGIVSSLVYSDETTWHPRWKIPLENLWKHHFRDSNFQNVSTIDASSLKNLCLWYELQSYLLFIIRLLLRNFLTALSAG